jgi:Na+/H+ antiporter NhaC
MKLLINFSPILLFVIVAAGSSLYFACHNVHHAFYQILPIGAILPAFILGCALHRGTSDQPRTTSFLDSVSYHDIISMWMIFLLAVLFSVITNSIGSVEATVNLVLSLVYSRFLLIAVFAVSAFITTAIGTSLGAIAALAPIAMGLAKQHAFGCDIGMATVVAGAMFGDNLSLVSDTTIAAVRSQGASRGKKLILNAIFATVASVITVFILFAFYGAPLASYEAQPYRLFLLLPYAFLITLSLTGIDALHVLLLAIIGALGVGWVASDYSLAILGRDVAQGFHSMYEIMYDVMLLSILVSGLLSGLVSIHLDAMTAKLEEYLERYRGKKRAAQLFIAGIVSGFTVLLANNTAAIVFSGKVAKNIAKRSGISPHYSATLLDIFSAVVQGILPYGAPILLASSISGVSPMAIALRVYYCYVLGGVLLIYILFNKNKKLAD